MWVHAEEETVDAVDRWKEKREDFADLLKIWRTNEEKTARRGREEIKKEERSKGSAKR